MNVTGPSGRGRHAHSATALLVAGCLSMLPAVRLPAQQTSLTIYNDGRVFARRSLPVAVPKGESTQRATPAVES